MISIAIVLLQYYLLFYLTVLLCTQCYASAVLAVGLCLSVYLLQARWAIEMFS